MSSPQIIYFSTGLYHFELLIYAIFGKPGLSLQFVHWSLRDDLSSGPVVLGPGGRAVELGSTRVPLTLSSTSTTLTVTHRKSHYGPCIRRNRWYSSGFPPSFFLPLPPLILIRIPPF